MHDFFRSAIETKSFQKLPRQKNSRALVEKRRSYGFFSFSYWDNLKINNQFPYLVLFWINFCLRNEIAPFFSNHKLHKYKLFCLSKFVLKNEFCRRDQVSNLILWSSNFLFVTYNVDKFNIKSEIIHFRLGILVMD